MGYSYIVYYTGQACHPMATIGYYSCIFHALRYMHTNPIILRACKQPMRRSYLPLVGLSVTVWNGASSHAVPTASMETNTSNSIIVSKSNIHSEVVWKVSLCISLEVGIQQWQDNTHTVTRWLAPPSLQSMFSGRAQQWPAVHHAWLSRHCQRTAANIGKLLHI